ncbi:hypothetical protein [Pedobacter sp. SYP-B3415]|uniref:S24 family peptidase n=1 Tax=Pedobacter sp. SYP-B3415 TaxID=2496641 RepID=UPI00101C7AC3|nr:hypothetical protein [Pedobacter sp. SYP-B3415]
MTPIKERLVAFIKEIKLDNRSFERQAGLSNGFVNNIGDSIRRSSLEKISNAFPELDLSWLISGQGSRTALTNINNARRVSEIVYPLEDHDGKFAETSDGQINLIIPIVYEYAYGGFPGGYRDPEYMDTLVRQAISVEKKHSGNYVGFEVIGDSMENLTSRDNIVTSIFEGSIAVGREVQRQHWQSRLHSHRWNAFIVAHRDEGLTCKKIIAQDLREGTITLSAHNPDKVRHPDFTWHLDDITAIFNVVKAITDM